MILNSIVYNFCINRLAYLRYYQEDKLILNKKHAFIKNQYTPTRHLSGCLVKKGLFKYYYFKTTYTYRLFLLLYNKKKLNTFSLFFFSLSKDLLYYDLNFSLFLWSKQWLSLFRLEKIKHKKHPKTWIRYVKLKRRYILVWRWLSLLVQCLKLYYKKWDSSFLALWHEVFLQPSSESKLLTLKLKVYKIYLYKLY